MDNRPDLDRHARAWRLAAYDRGLDDDSILGLIGIGRSGRSDVSERHDDYLAQDVLDQMQRVEPPSSTRRPGTP